MKKPSKKKSMVKKLSPTEQLKADLEKQRGISHDWRQKYEATLEGQIERLRAGVEEACDQLESSQRAW